ncbi:Spermine/spermidine synthase [Ostertagia ostertagi]
MSSEQVAHRIFGTLNLSISCGKHRKRVQEGFAEDPASKLSRPLPELDIPPIKDGFRGFQPHDLEKGMKQAGSSDSKQLKSDGVVMGGAWPGQAFSLKVKEVLFHEKSEYQDVLRILWECLVLDGIIQATERDEFSYQEMLAHLPMFAHPNPKKGSIIWRGDGAYLREASEASRSRAASYLECLAASLILS